MFINICMTPFFVVPWYLPLGENLKRTPCCVPGNLCNAVIQVFFLLFFHCLWPPNLTVVFEACCRRFKSPQSDMSRNAHNNKSGKKEKNLWRIWKIRWKWQFCHNRQRGKAQSSEESPYKLAKAANLANMAKMTILPQSPTRQSTKQWRGQ